VQYENNSDHMEQEFLLGIFYGRVKEALADELIAV
jgi:hypothetical protein